MIKKLFVVVLIFYCFFGSKNDVLADVFFSNYSSTFNASVTATNGITYQVAALSSCGVSNTTCNRGSSSSDCGTTYGDSDCRTASSGCCSGANNWTKNRSMCVKKTNTITGSVSYIPAWGKIDRTCSTADKQIGSEPGLRAGYCTCGYSPNIYKYCCDSAGYPEQPIMSWSDDDGAYPPEKDCPGGYRIDGDRVRSSPCTPNCVPNCAATDGGVCAGTTYTGNCGQNCTGTKPLDYTNGACGAPNGQTYSTYNLLSSVAESSLCSAGTLVWTDGPGSIAGTDWNWNCVGTTGTCGTGVTANCSAIKNYSGVCGSANGQTYSANVLTDVVNGTQLCSSGTLVWTDGPGVIAGNDWNWECRGQGIGVNVACSAIKDIAPTYSSMVIQNADGATVAAEDGVRNQICQTTFTNSSNPNLVKFIVTFTDVQGGNDISSADLGISDGSYNKTYTTTTFTVSGNNATATFNVPKSDISSTNILNIYARAYDNHASNGVTSIAADTGRDFKFWNCNVPVSGRLYNGGASGSCSVAADYLTPATATNFKTLDFTDSPTMNMSRSSENQYTGNLTWGKTYTAIFNSDIAMQILGSGVKTTDVSAGTSSCPNSVVVTLNNGVINPYSASPSLRIDFSGVVDQDSWYQAVGGGLMANNVLTNRVPITCTTANCAMSISGTNGINGIIASKVISNTGNSDAKKGNPNDWWVAKPLVSSVKSDYSYFLNQYFWEKGIGTTLNGDKNMSDIGTTGIYFVNGNLNVTTNNSVPVGSFLMVLASGNITVDPSVTNLEGIFVSNNMNIGGSNATALSIKGIIKTSQNVKISRTFVNKRINNTTPAVNLIYRPDFIFSMPGEIARQLVKWQWGN